MCVCVIDLRMVAFVLILAYLLMVAKPYTGFELCSMFCLLSNTSSLNFYRPSALSDVQCIYAHPFNSPFSGTTQVSRYQKGKTNLDFTEASDSEWQWHQLGHMQVCTLLQTDNHTSTPPLFFYRPDALPAAQPTVSKH